MKVAVIGAGAIGGLVGARLAEGGADVTFIVRGAHIDAIRERGFTIVGREGSERRVTALRATDDYAAAGAQDVVVLALKAHQLDAVAARVAPLLGSQTLLLTMQNGIPFWYFHRHGGEYEGRVVRSVDASGTLATLLPPERVIGCVVYPASELVAPGVVRHIEGERLPVGELDGSRSERVQRVAALLESGGFKAPVLDDIRAEIWLKLWGNLTFNPISALAHATLVDICRDEHGRALAAEMMREAQAVAARLGITFRVSLEARIAGAEKVGAHKTSMLQDVEGGREPEIDALVGAVAELARVVDVPTPRIDTVYQLVKLLAATMAAQHAGVRLG
jgi:2-dehydropantoate 2-reductase